MHAHGHTHTHTHIHPYLLNSAYSWRRQWQPTPVLLPGKSHGQRSLVDCSPWGHEESDTTEQLHFHFSPSCIGEGNGNPLQCSCLENPRDGESGGLPSMESHRVGHDWSDLAVAVLLFSKRWPEEFMQFQELLEHKRFIISSWHPQILIKHFICFNSVMQV